jgi:serine/arginine repetitive matrix protein 2
MTAAVSTAPKIRKADPGILEHNRKRKLELALAEYEQELELEGIPSEEIPERVAEMRQKLKKLEVDDESLFAGDSSTHEQFLLKEKEMERVRTALGISLDYTQGKAFDFEAQEAKKQALLEHAEDEAPRMPRSWLDRLDDHPKRSQEIPRPMFPPSKEPRAIEPPRESTTRGWSERSERSSRYVYGRSRSRSPDRRSRERTSHSEKQVSNKPSDSKASMIHPDRAKMIESQVTRRSLSPDEERMRKRRRRSLSGSRERGRRSRRYSRSRSRNRY